MTDAFFFYSAWGDSLFILLQTLLIVILVLNYNVSKKTATFFTTIYSCWLAILLSDIVPNYHLWNMQFISIPLMFFGKVITYNYNFYYYLYNIFIFI